MKGYSIRFISQPIQNKKEISNQHWSETEILHIKNQVSKLLQKGAIKKCEPAEAQLLSSFFLVPKPDGTHRLIINLKKLNEFVSLEHFKIKDTKVITQILSPDDFMITPNLKDAYYLISVKKSHKKF